MAERRCFTQKITESDAFLDMPLSAQALYFHLCMNGDDDGFVKNPKRIAKMVNASDDDFRLLVAKSFCIAYESGVIVIKHWRMHNSLRNDRYKPTEYVEERSTLYLKANNSYTLDSAQGIPLGNRLATKCQPSDNQMETQHNITKHNITEHNETELNQTDNDPSDQKKVKHKYGEYQHVLLTDNEREKLDIDYGVEKALDIIAYFDAYIEEKGYKAKSHYLSIKRWVAQAVDEQKQRTHRNNSVSKEQAKMDSFKEALAQFVNASEEGT